MELSMSDYRLLDTLVPYLSWALFFFYFLFGFVFVCCFDWAKLLQEKLASYSLDLLFKDGKSKEVMKMEKFPSKFLLPLYSMLPILLWLTTVLVFWDNYAVYRIDNTCEPKDQRLDCFFTDESGPMPCETALDIAGNSSSFVCYKLLFDFPTAAASAGGVLTVSLFLNEGLVACFVCTRYIRGPRYMWTLLLQVIVVLSDAAVFFLYVNYASDFKFDNYLEVTGLFIRVVLLAVFPWFLIEPKQHDYPWLPSCIQRRDLPTAADDSESRALMTQKA